MSAKTFLFLGVFDILLVLLNVYLALFQGGHWYSWAAAIFIALIAAWNFYQYSVQKVLEEELEEKYQAWRSR